jgi:hypothetical protein
MSVLVEITQEGTATVITDDNTMVEVQVPVPTLLLEPVDDTPPILEVVVPGQQGIPGESPIHIGSTPPDDPVTKPLWLNTA